MRKFSDNMILYKRRTFITNVVKAAGAATLLSIPDDGAAAPAEPANAYTVQDVINIILKEIPGAPFNDTVDTIKSGDASQKVTGIATTMFPTVDIIRQAAKMNANFIIAHEPTFYNHRDDPNWVADNSVVKQKEHLLNQNEIVVWRFHDYWHACRPDGILHGVLKKTGWTNYYKPQDGGLIIPLTPLKKIIEHLKSSLGIPYVRFIGELDKRCEKIALLPGAWGGQRQVGVVEKEKPDLLIVGELQEWETAEYIRDTRAFGSKTALLVLGHAVSEEPGMEWLVEWLQPKIPGLKVTHLPSGNPFKWI